MYLTILFSWLRLALAFRSLSTLTYTTCLAAPGGAWAGASSSKQMDPFQTRNWRIFPPMTNDIWSENKKTLLNQLSTRFDKVSNYYI